MRSPRWFAVYLVLVALAGATLAISCAPQTARQAATSTAADTLARGRYLATVGGCGDCHTPGTLYGTPDMTRQLSGSELGWSGPWGTSYPRNLTPDSQTGIGDWTPPQIVNAIRTGTRPNGTRLLPPMPWPELANLTDADAHAVALYLKSLPTVAHKVPEVLPPGKKCTGPAFILPPPAAWDAPRSAQQGAKT